MLRAGIVRALNVAAFVLALAVFGLVAVALVPPRPPDVDSVAPTPTPAATPTASVTPTATQTPEIQLPDTTRTEEPTRTPPAADTLRIRIERLGIDLPLASGDIERDVPQPGFAGNTPENVALVFPGSAPFASGGNTYIYAHARVGMFLSLWKVALGDEVVVYCPADPSVLLRYTVTEIHPRVSPSDTTWLDPSGPERLTLQTSTGPVASDPRFIVIAVPIPAAAP